MSANPNKTSFILLEFTYEGQVDVLNICDAEEDLSTPVGEFNSLTSLSINKVVYQGGISDSIYRVSIKEDAFGLASQITEGTAFPIVTVKAWEYSLSDNVRIALPLFEGEIHIGRRNADGRSGLFQFEIRNDKSRLAISSGIPAYEECDNTFESIYSCKFNADLLRVNRNVDFIDNVTITLEDSLPVEGRLWPRGYVEFQSLRILILDWDGDSQLRLATRPPTTWLGQNILISPGCDQLAGTCETVYMNISEFAGYGVGMVDYNPIFENPR